MVEDGELRITNISRADYMSSNDDDIDEPQFVFHYEDHDEEQSPQSPQIKQLQCTPRKQPLPGTMPDFFVQNPNGTTTTTTLARLLALAACCFLVAAFKYSTCS